MGSKVAANPSKTGIFSKNREKIDFFNKNIENFVKNSPRRTFL
jgi:hypothetical protein